MDLYDDKCRYISWGDESDKLVVSDISKAMTSMNMAKMLDTWLNSMSRDGFRSGKDVGSLLRTTHRTLQRSVMCFALGILVGISEQSHSDARNAQALEVAKKISKMVEDGELNMGMFI